MSSRSERKMKRYRSTPVACCTGVFNGNPRFACKITGADDLKVREGDFVSPKLPLLITKYTRAATAQDAAEQMRKIYKVPHVYAVLDEVR